MSKTQHQLERPRKNFLPSDITAWNNLDPSIESSGTFDNIFRNKILKLIRPSSKSVLIVTILEELNLPHDYTLS